MATVRSIELLAPAKTAEIGVEAIKHGADAVYIGAPRFSARASAGNELEDIARLVKYAHFFNARVYVALNTILKDDELDDARSLIFSLYNIGADALIVQDMGILELDIPPIALHASTQADNRSVEKVKFLESVGFSQVVLARELSAEQIRTIADNTTVPLEVFVHGALCVSYSGQCYLSSRMCGRSANRGECAQYCRLPYTLKDADGRTLLKDKYILSLKDLNLSSELGVLLDSGASSLKIEGRLKDMGYVKNVTAYYRNKLDEIFSKDSRYKRASDGKSSFFFIPDVQKSFNRGFSSYFIHGQRSASLCSFDTPKSKGEKIGTVRELSRQSLTVSENLPLNNGDGICYINNDGVFAGFRINKIEGNRVYPTEMPFLRSGTVLYRNYDHEFEKVLSKKSAERYMEVDFDLSETPHGFELTVTDETGISVSEVLNSEKEESRTPQRENIIRQLSKLGDTSFVIRQFNYRLSNDWFVPSSVWSGLRRRAIEKLSLQRERSYCREARKSSLAKECEYPEKEMSYLGNVSNRLARAFYEKHGVKKIEEAFECAPSGKVPLMFTKYCVKYTLGMCPHSTPRKSCREPLTLHYKDAVLRLEFDCRRCEMRVYDNR